MKSQINQLSLMAILATALMLSGCASGMKPLNFPRPFKNFQNRKFHLPFHREAKSNEPVKPDSSFADNSIDSDLYNRAGFADSRYDENSNGYNRNEYAQPNSQNNSQNYNQQATRNFQGADHNTIQATHLSNANIPARTNASGVWHESYAKAVEESKATGKPILATFSGSDWCHWCVKLKDEVFARAEFTRWAKQNVVLLELDYPKRSAQRTEIRQQNQQLAQRYGIDSYPTILFLNTHGEVLGKSSYVRGGPAAWTAKADAVLQGNRY